MAMRRDPEDETIGVQRIVERSFLFVYAPILIIAVLSLNFLWEAFRLNVSPSVRASWPMRFTLVDMTATANLLGIAVGLSLARLQWSHAVRPTIGFAIDDDGAKFSIDSPEWRVWLHNGGPGVAVIENLTYIVKFAREGIPGTATMPATLGELNRAMAHRGLRDGVDYFVRWQGRGAPLPSVSSYADGSKLGWFTPKALAQ